VNGCAKVIPLRIGRTRSTPSVVSQRELEELEDLQRLERHISRLANKLAAELHGRMQFGSAVEPGRLMFDADLRMARSAYVDTKTGS
jgi:hypothetical protein